MEHFEKTRGSEGMAYIYEILWGGRELCAPPFFQVHMLIGMSVYVIFFLNGRFYCIDPILGNLTISCKI